MLHATQTCRDTVDTSLEPNLGGASVLCPVLIDFRIAQREGEVPTEPFTGRLSRSFARFALPNLFGLFKGSTIWVASGAAERLRQQGRRR